MTNATGTLTVTVGPNVSFTPTSFTIPVAKTVTWNWAAGSVSHGVQWLTGPTLPTNSATQTSGTYQVTFTTGGTYTYNCTVHGNSMTGTIIVQ